MQRAIYKPLSFHKLKSGAGFHQPSTYRLVHVDSPAIEVMTDLQQVSAATIGPDVKLSEATQTMISRGVRLLLVVHPDGKHGDLKVHDCMTSIDTIEVLALSDVLRAEVGHIVATLKHAGRQHAMVVDTDVPSGNQSVRGIFSITQIGRQLGMSLQAFEIAKTFAEIEAALAAS